MKQGKILLEPKHLKPEFYNKISFINISIGEDKDNNLIFSTPTELNKSLCDYKSYSIELCENYKKLNDIYILNSFIPIKDLLLKYQHSKKSDCCVFCNVPRATLETVIQMLTTNNGFKYFKYLSNKSFDQIETTEVEEEKMNNTSITTALTTLSTQTQDDAKNAVWRNTATFALLAVKAPLLKVLNQYCTNSFILDFLKNQLETKEGEAVLSYLLGTTLPLIPNFSENDRMLRLAQEMRIKGFETLFSEVLKNVLLPLINPLKEVLSTVDFTEK